MVDLGENSLQTEIAFFGGSFTAIDRDYMLSLLQAVQPYRDRFYGVRISTRPDAIDDEALVILRDHGVTAIELGAQSMDDSVLDLNKRGHSAQDVKNASALIREYGFSLGLQMMTGLYGSTPEKDMATAQQFVAIRPDTVRIYPTVILEGTLLADYYRHGIYTPYSLQASVDLCAELILLFEQEHIAVIRLGLHDSESLRRNSLADNYHPAFKELCENKIFLDRFLQQAAHFNTKTLTVSLHPKSLSKFLGQKKCNWQALCDRGYDISVTFDDALGKYELSVS